MQNGYPKNCICGQKAYSGAAMKYIFLNLKRFDIQRGYGGVNSVAPPRQWGAYIVSSIRERLCGKKGITGRYVFPVFFPEAHLIPAASVLPNTPAADECPVELGCQSVYHCDTSPGGNFGAFTSLRTASSAKQLGCTWTIIGHSEERRSKAEYMALAGAGPERIRKAVHELLNGEIMCAQKAGLNVLYCIGEAEEDVPRRTEVLTEQIRDGLAGADTSRVVLGYEPLWAIGPGKTPPSARQIAQTAEEIKKLSPCPLVYGGGLKKENAESIGSVSGLDGGLIALTRFSGDIGFYPDEYIEIIDAYMKGAGK